MHLWTFKNTRINWPWNCKNPVDITGLCCAFSYFMGIMGKIVKLMMLIKNQRSTGLVDSRKIVEHWDDWKLFRYSFSSSNSGSCQYFHWKYFLLCSCRPGLVRVDLQTKSNNVAHHTSEISLEQLVLRRGQSFNLTVQLFDPISYPLNMSAQTGWCSVHLLGTLPLVKQIHL